MRSRPLISTDCSLTLHLCQRAGGGGEGVGDGEGGGNGAVNHSCPVIVGEILCLSGHFLLPPNGDVASFMCTSQL